MTLERAKQLEPGDIVLVEAEVAEAPPIDDKGNCAIRLYQRGVGMALAYIAPDAIVPAGGRF